MQCSTCGNSLADGASHCAQCGASVAGAPSNDAASAQPPASVPVASPPSAPSPAPPPGQPTSPSSSFSLVDDPETQRIWPDSLTKVSNGARVGYFVLGFFLSLIGLLVTWLVNRGKDNDAMRWAILGFLVSLCIRSAWGLATS